MRKHVVAAALSAAAVAAITGIAFALRPIAPVLSLGVLYVVAVVAVATLYGVVYATVISVASMIAFNFFFLPPVHTLALRDSANWVALGVYLATAVVVSELAGRSRRRAEEAEQRQREAAFLADASATLIDTGHVGERLREIAIAAETVLGLSDARIELGSLRRPDREEVAYDLDVRGRHVGRLFARGEMVDESAGRRILPALASVLASADDRERFARTAVEAETLRRSDALKTALLRAVSHDLRSPITAIRAAADGLELDLDQVDRSELLTTIKAAAVRLERLVTNLIDLSRLEAGAAQPRPELWTADELIARALETLGPDAERVVVELAVTADATTVDAAQIERALVNVVENALKFSSEPVEIGATAEGDRLTISVRDRGPGIDPREVERIFEPFEVGRSSEARGTGLGLAIATGFAQANSATLSASPAAGGGTVFRLSLPRVEVPARVRA
jgi:two-component system, OmpR family, sensor histidine kinase KdpD